MAYEQRDNSGSLFKNNKKQSDNHPDYTGSAMIDGAEYWINAWVKQGRDGNKFFSFSFKRKDVQQPADYAKRNRSPHNPKMSADFDDDLAF